MAAAPPKFDRESLAEWSFDRSGNQLIFLSARAGLRLVPELEALFRSRNSPRKLHSAQHATFAAFGQFSSAYCVCVQPVEANKVQKLAHTLHGLSHRIVEPLTAEVTRNIQVNLLLAASHTSNAASRLALGQSDAAQIAEKALSSLWKGAERTTYFNAWVDALRKDCERLEPLGDGPLLDIASDRLWESQGDFAASKIEEIWAQFRDQLGGNLAVDDVKWTEWIRWYQQRLDGEAYRPKIERARIFDLPIEDWAAGPSVANARIETIVRQFGLKAPAKGLAAKVAAEKDRANLEFQDSVEIDEPPKGFYTTGVSVDEEVIVNRLYADDSHPNTPREAELIESVTPHSDEPSGTEAKQHPDDDAVDMVGDDPTEDDQLGRLPFAQMLVDKMNTLREGGSHDFAVHLHARWGAGKTSILKMMKGLMEKAPGRQDRWVVVEFNAWEHEQRQPPWWPFVEAVRRSVLFNLRNRGILGWPRFIWVWLQWWWWELTARWWPIPLFLGSFLFLGVSFWPDAEPARGLVSANEPRSFLPGLSGVMGNVEIITARWAAAVGMLLGGFTAFRNVLFGSEENTKHFEKLSNDPMRRVKRFYRSLIKGAGRPVCVFIDDLDRCQAAYVVMLLEGIQTSFRHDNVAFLVAADRQWIRRSFEVSYKDFSALRPDPRSALGYDFLEKVFQISAPVPGMGRRKTHYWSGLVTGEVQTAEQTGMGTMSTPRGELGAWQELRTIFSPTRNEPPRGTPLRLRAALERVASRFADLAISILFGSSASMAVDLLKDISLAREAYRAQHDPKATIDLDAELVNAETEVEKDAVVLEWAESAGAKKESKKALLVYEDLMPDNPRVMKRMINAYAVRKATLGIERNPLPREAIARWTVLEQRFPIVADALIQDAELVAHFSSERSALNPKELGEELYTFAQDTTVRAIIAHGSEDGLDANQVRVLTRAFRTV